MIKAVVPNINIICKYHCDEIEKHIPKWIQNVKDITDETAKKLILTEKITVLPPDYKDEINKIILIVKNNLHNILMCKPQDLLSKSELFNAYNKVYGKVILQIFNYDSFSSKNSEYCAYHLAKKLNVNTCLYCNRSYTYTVFKNNNEKISRPEYDHFYAKSDHPALALSFYNLIPSCHICNSTLKGNMPFTIDKNIHPYVEGFGRKARFTYTYDDSLNTYDVKFLLFKNSEKMKNNIEAFNLTEMYQCHTDIIEEIVQKAEMYNKFYLIDIVSILNKKQGKKISLQELKESVFGKYIHSKDDHKVLLSKFSREILEVIKTSSGYSF